MKIEIGNRVRMLRDRFSAEGIVVDVRQLAELDNLATLDRPTSLALLAEGNWQQGIAVRYQYMRDVDGSEVWATSILLEDEHGDWWNLFGRPVEIECVPVQENLMLVSTASYPD